MAKHVRNTGPMLASPRCSAKNRSGRPCRAPAVYGKTHCRMHGGGARSGAPKGNQNAVKHGLYTNEAREERRKVRELLRDTRRFMRDLAGR